jgi:D-alanyl-D-alanine dipeptidase
VFTAQRVPAQIAPQVLSDELMFSQYLTPVSLLLLVPQVYDAYRPQRAVDAFWAWSQDPADQVRADATH